MLFKKTSRTGFSIVEIMVVMMIVSILFVSSFGVNSVLNSFKATKAFSNIEVLESAILAYKRINLALPGDDKIGNRWSLEEFNKKCFLKSGTLQTIPSGNKSGHVLFRESPSTISLSFYKPSMVTCHLAMSGFEAILSMAGSKLRTTVTSDMSDPGSKNESTLFLDRRYRFNFISLSDGAVSDWIAYSGTINGKMPFTAGAIESVEVLKALLLKMNALNSGAVGSGIKLAWAGTGSRPTAFSVVNNGLYLLSDSGMRSFHTNAKRNSIMLLRNVNSVDR